MNTNPVRLAHTPENLLASVTRLCGPGVPPEQALTAEDYLAGLPVGGVVRDAQAGTVIRRVAPEPMADILALCRDAFRGAEFLSQEFILTTLMLDFTEQAPALESIAALDVFIAGRFAAHVVLVRLHISGMPVVVALSREGDGARAELMTFQVSSRLSDQELSELAADFAGPGAESPLHLPLDLLILGARACRELVVDFGLLEDAAVIARATSTAAPRFGVEAGAVFLGEDGNLDLWLRPATPDTPPVMLVRIGNEGGAPEVAYLLAPQLQDRLGLLLTHPAALVLCRLYRASQLA